MKRAMGSTVALAAVAIALIATEHAPTARADAAEPHVAGALQALRSAKMHLEALPRSDKRDQALEKTQDALKATEELAPK